jgi:hypothetical protein
VALVDDRTEMPLRNTMKFQEERYFVVRAPCGYRQPTVRCKRLPHLLRGGWLIRKELESLLADNNVEPLTVSERQSAGVAFSPIDTRGHGARNSQHRRTNVDADDVSGTT